MGDSQPIPWYFDRLTAEDRAELAADAGLCARFRAEADRIYAEGPPSAGGYAWDLSDSYDRTVFNPSRVLAHVRGLGKLEAARAEIARDDARISVAIAHSGQHVVTNLHALCAEFGLDWAERCNIRESLKVGVAYEKDRYRFRSKLPWGAVVTGVAAKREAA